MPDPFGRWNGGKSPSRAGGSQAALPYTGALFAAEDAELAGIAPVPNRAGFLAAVAPVIARATLVQPQEGGMQPGGRDGRHSEHLGHLLAELHSLARAHPGAVW